ncbi:MAG: MerR family transcriptional regulator [Ferruginibacter sp.]
MDLFTIKDLENLSGIKAHTLRVWEQRYNFLKPSRTFTNIRYYSNDELKTILNIALLNKYGFKISHIDKMSAAQINEKILSLNQLEAQQERIVNDLIRHMIDLDMDTFEITLGNFILARGVERAIVQIIFPFMQKIGILWLTNHINPAQEHLVSNIIRQKLIVGIEGATSPIKLKKTILLFLPEGEYHELGLLFMYYLLKSRGASVIYLGSNVPLNDIEYVVNLKKPDYLYSHLTTVSQNFNFDHFLSKISKKFRSTPIIISGQFTWTYEKKIKPPVIFKKSFTEAMDFVSGLK